MSQTDLHKFSMYFHTTLRNIGLYTTLSYGSLAYSRVYRGTTPIYDIMLIVVSVSFLSIAFLLNYFLYQDMKAFVMSHKEGEELDRWIPISQAIFGIHTVLFLLGGLTFFRSVNYI